MLYSCSYYWPGHDFVPHPRHEIVAMLALPAVARLRSTTSTRALRNYPSLFLFLFLFLFPFLFLSPLLFPFLFPLLFLVLCPFLFIFPFPFSFPFNCRASAFRLPVPFSTAFETHYFRPTSLFTTFFTSFTWSSFRHFLIF